ncbi:MAG: hypothetical protein IPP79_17865 [Chitinophagaceae bacterium]|nr:hypothetical protein [Chitinophagaceae bacterium]
MKKRIFRGIGLSAIFIIPVYCFSQNAGADSLFILKFQDSVLQQYYTKTNANTPIYSGAEYIGHGQSISGHAFFVSETPTDGIIEYDGILYKKLLVRYELVEDAIILKDYTQNYFIQLNSAKISRFWIGNSEFIRPSFVLPESKFPSPGFYQRLYNGKSWVLAKRSKQLIYKTTEEKVTMQYKTFNSYYIMKGNEIITISGKKDIISAFEDKKVEIRKFIGEKHLNFKKDPEGMLISICTYFDQLKN